MILTIRGWEFDTAELSAFPAFTTGNGQAELLADGGRLAQAYHAAGCDCLQLAEQLGIRYKLLRQALSWYGIWPTRPVPVAVWPEAELPPGNGKERPRLQPVGQVELDPKPPAARGRSQELTRETLREAVARAYLRNDQCPPDCPGWEECLSPSQPICYWYGGRDDLDL